MKNWIIIPVYNESKYIKRVITNVLKYTKNIIVVDDGSSDSTAIKASKILPDVLIHDVNLGKGAAMKTGAEYAFSHKKADSVIFLDGDDQHDPHEIKRFLSELKKGSQVVFGVRHFRANMPLVRFLGNKFASVIINIILGSYFPDIPSGYKAMTKKAFKKIDWTSAGYEVETEIAVKVARHKITYSEIPIPTIYHDTDKGFTILDALRILVKLPQWIWG